jgi:hypothetical protein
METDWAGLYPYVIAILASLALALGSEPPAEGMPPFEECMESGLPNSSFASYGEMGWGEPGSPAPAINVHALCALSQLYSAQPAASYSSPGNLSLDSLEWLCPRNDSDLCNALDSIPAPSG